MPKRERKQKPPKKKKEKAKKKKQAQSIAKEETISNNIYNLLFDEIAAFYNDLNHMSLKAIRQSLILLDGKMLWIEKLSEQDLLREKGSEDIIDMELQMLEMGMDLESAEELKDEFSPLEMDLTLEDFKAEMNEAKSFGQELRELIKDIEEDTNPIDELAYKFLLYDLRVFLERAINEVFRLQGKINRLKKKEGTEKQIKNLQIDQKRAVKSQLKEMLAKLKKEKPVLVFPEEKIKEYKELTVKQIVEIKRQEEQQFDQLVKEIMDDKEG
ncbi:MAG: hypothetical protein ACTSXO_06110 [Candidatus Heimdallarchaeota archaeon]|nr:MAG: hypothetical protein DRP02_07040 [Candidatus Gerdarchaeota archaeon]